MPSPLTELALLFSRAWPSLLIASRIAAPLRTLSKISLTIQAHLVTLVSLSSFVMLDLRLTL